MSENLSDALHDQAQLLAIKQRANEVARVLSQAAHDAGSLATDARDGNSALHTAATKAEELVSVVLGALDEIGLYGLQTAARATRTSASRSDRVRPNPSVHASVHARG